MNDFKLRTESLKDDEILKFAIKNSNDEKIISALKSSEPCLLEGSRGTGKSFIMKMAQLDLEESEEKTL